MSLCVDNKVRLIAVNDRVDTAEDGWEDSAFISTWHHERSNRDTSERIKRSLRNRFVQGGVCMTFPYGYIKPPDTKSDAECRKDPDAEPIYDEWFARLERNETYAEVSDWLNQRGIPTGPWCDQKYWDGTLVGLVTRNPILKGQRQRNKRVSRRVNKTGRHRSEKAPPEAFWSATFRTWLLSIRSVTTAISVCLRSGTQSTAETEAAMVTRVATFRANERDFPVRCCSAAFAAGSSCLVGMVARRI